MGGDELLLIMSLNTNSAEYEKESQKQQADFWFIFVGRLPVTSRRLRLKAACFTGPARNGRMAEQ